MEKKFTTQTGYCHILPDKIVLTRYGTPGNVAGATSGNQSIAPTIAGRVGMTVVLAYLIYISVRQENWIQTALSGLLCLFFFYSVFTYLDQSMVPVIERAAIRKIRFIKGIPFLTRSRLEITFENQQGKPKRRLLFLPGMFNSSKQQTEEALALLRSENLLKL